MPPGALRGRAVRADGLAALLRPGAGVEALLPLLGGVVVVATLRWCDGAMVREVRRLQQGRCAAALGSGRAVRAWEVGG
jgi:hypothetical protein